MVTNDSHPPQPAWAERVAALGFRNPAGIHNQPPFEAWQLTANPAGPWGIRSRTGVNCAGALAAPGACFMLSRSQAEAIAAALRAMAQGSRDNG